MLRLLLGFPVFLAVLQWPTSLEVNRIFVESPYNASIIFEYANAALPEDQPLANGATDCLTSELYSTGLFTDIRVTLVPLQDGRKVDVNIVPTWIQQREKLVIEEIVFDGFAGINEGEIRKKLEGRGLAQGAPLLQYPVQKIHTEVREAVNEIFKNEPKKADDVAEQISELSVRLRLVAPLKVRLTVAAGLRNLCRL